MYSHLDISHFISSSEEIKAAFIPVQPAFLYCSGPRLKNKAKQNNQPNNHTHPLQGEKNQTVQCVTTHSELGLPTSVINQESVPQICLQATWWRHFLNWGLLFGDDSSLSQLRRTSQHRCIYAPPPPRGIGWSVLCCVSATAQLSDTAFCCHQLGACSVSYS